MDMFQVSELLLFMDLKMNLSEIVLAGKVSGRTITPREVLDSPGSLEVSKARLDGAWRSLG